MRRRKPLKNQIWYLKRRATPVIKNITRLLIIIILIAVLYLVLEVYKI